MANVVCSPTRSVRYIHQLIIALVAICGIAQSVSAQTTVTLSAPGSHINADQTIRGGAFAWADFSGSDMLASKVSSESYTRRIVMKFDTQNYIPANAVIQSAKLYLVLKNAESGEYRPLTAYYVNQSFARGQVNWMQFRDGQYWNTSGGDLGQSFGTTWVGNAVGSAYEFDLTEMVQRTVNGEFGSRYTRLALIDTGASAAGNYRTFYSTRAGDESVRPRLVITYGDGGGGGGYTAPAPTTISSPSTGSTLRVMQWNVHKTKGTDDVCNPDRTANAIVAQNVDVVGINEVNFYSGACAWSFDMGERLQSLLQEKTGVTWYRQAVNPDGVGNVILSRLPPASASSTMLSYSRGVAQMTVVVNGRYVNLFSTHVAYYETSWRPIQIAEAVWWMSNFSEPRIMMGDFNTWPDTGDYNIIASPYQDAWTAAQNAGTASAYNGTGTTHGASRFDYVFHSRVGALTLMSVTVPSTYVDGVYASDHDPVVAVYRVN